MSKIYGLFCPYHKSEFFEVGDSEYNELPSYPREFRRVRSYIDKNAQMSGFANTLCPASQIFECEEEELETTLNDLNSKFDNEEWLRVNIYPYV